ncbi:MAG: allophanate hydrolase subunit 1 [Devosia sp.]|nr:allophanate hydrolase subunit 1 [Devosia sp.]
MTAGSQYPTLIPLGGQALLVRFGTSLDDAANRRAIDFARLAALADLPGVLEIVPNLVSVLLRFEATVIDFDWLAGEVRLLLSARLETHIPTPVEHAIGVVFDGPDLAELAAGVGLTEAQFIDSHNAQPLRVLATGFAPGFVYLGFHPAELVVPRRTAVRPMVPAGTVLFAAGQTAITATAIPTGWNVIGHTDFANFDASKTPPTLMRAGDSVRFEALS